MAEELGFEQVPGKRGAVDDHEALGGPLALQVEGPGHQLLARAALGGGHLIALRLEQTAGAPEQQLLVIHHEDCQAVGGAIGLTHDIGVRWGQGTEMYPKAKPPDTLWRERGASELRPAASYSPTRSPGQYHPRNEA